MEAHISTGTIMNNDENGHDDHNDDVDTQNVYSISFIISFIFVFLSMENSFLYCNSCV